MERLLRHQYFDGGRSPLAQRRGLEPYARKIERGAKRRLSRRGVDWNPTSPIQPVNDARVASRAEAWIGTLSSAAIWISIASPLAQRRGLERDRGEARALDVSSPLAQRRGLEPRRRRPCDRRAESPLAQRRGLEPAGLRRRSADPRSPLAQRRGLEHDHGGARSGDIAVASRAEAWIGTNILRMRRGRSPGRLSRRGVDWNRGKLAELTKLAGRLSRRGVDWNTKAQPAFTDISYGFRLITSAWRFLATNGSRRGF